MMVKHSTPSDKLTLLSRGSGAASPQHGSTFQRKAHSDSPINGGIAFLATAMLLTLTIGGSAQAQVHEVSEGHLSVSVRQLVEGHGWSLIWATEEDRNIDVPFTITNRSLQDALTELLALYKGKLVADLYASNQVVVIDLAPPETRILMPGEPSPAEESDVDADDQ